MPRFFFVREPADQDTASSAKLCWRYSRVHVVAYDIRATDLHKYSLGEPLSPMSQCKSEGKHYTVKFLHESRARGVECLICGLIGDLEYVKSKACTPSPTATTREPSPTATLKDEDETAFDTDIARAHQEEADRRMAEELAELHATQAELEQLTLLQQLDAEELLLQGLLNEQRALELEKVKAARYKAVCDGLEPNSETPKPLKPTPEIPKPSSPESSSPSDPSPRVLFADPVIPENKIAKKPLISIVPRGSSDSLLSAADASAVVPSMPFGALDCRGLHGIGLWKDQTSVEYACMHAYISIHTHTHTHTHTSTYIYTYIYTCTYMCIYIYTLVCLCAYTYTNKQTYTHGYVHTHIHTNIHTYTSVHIYIHICIYLGINRVCMVCAQHVCTYVRLYLFINLNI